MKKFLLLAIMLFPHLTWANVIAETGERQPINIQAIIMFVLFVGFTLYITYWASKKNTLPD